MKYENLFENDSISLSHVIIMPHEEIGLHYDEYPQQVKAIQGGILTRLEADGSKTNVDFPEGKWVFRPAEDPEKMHKTVNYSSKPIELIIIQLK